MNDEKRDKGSKRNLIYFAMAIVLVVALNEYAFLTKNVESIPYSQFLLNVDNGKVTDVTISENKIFGTLKTENASAKPKEFITVPMSDDTLVERLQARGVTFRALPKNTFWSSAFPWLIPILLFYGLWAAFFRKAIGKAKGGLFSLTKSEAKVFVEKDVKTTFADVAGVEEAKDELQEIVHFLKDPARFGRLGGRAPKGVLLVGPPGTGKTLLARALAGEAKVPFFSINGSEFVEMFVGLGAARVRDLFQDARKQAPCIIFIDEIDALGKSRAYGITGTGANDEKEQTLHQLLAEMDGFDSSQGVIIIGATNRPEVLDAALLRAGRFDRQVLVNYPDQIGRVQILKVHIKKIKLDESVNLEQIAALTSGFSGADLANAVNEAALIAVRRNAEAVGQKDFTEAIERVVAGLEHKTRILNPEEKKRVAFHEMGHVTAALHLHLPEKIHKVSIVPRGLGALGYTLQRPIEDRYLVDYDELLKKIATLLGGRASEKYFFSSISTGAADDLVKATDLARAMVMRYAMSDKLGLATFEENRPLYLPVDRASGAAHGFSEKTAEQIDLELKSILDKAFYLAMAAIEANHRFIEQGAHRLLKTETLDEEQINELWTHRVRPFPKRTV